VILSRGVWNGEEPASEPSAAMYADVRGACRSSGVARDYVCEIGARHAHVAFTLLPFFHTHMHMSRIGLVGIIIAARW
jgi:hypothetical protein